MKKVLVLVLSVAIALVFASMVIAQTNPPEKVPSVSKTVPPAQTTPQQTPNTAAPMAKPATPAKPAVPAKAAHPKPVVPKERMIMGTVVSVDAVANTIVVKYKDVDRTFMLDPAAKIMVAGQEAKLADIQKDAKVTVVYKMDGKKKVALAIK